MADLSAKPGAGHRRQQRGQNISAEHGLESGRNFFRRHATLVFPGPAVDRGQVRLAMMLF